MVWRTVSDIDDLTLNEVAGVLGVHYMTVYRYVRTGRLPASRSGAQWRVASRDVVELQSARQATPLRRPAGSGPMSDRVRLGLQQRLKAGDEDGVWNVVQAMLIAGSGPEEILLDVVVPVMVALGDEWATGQASVGEEHRASQVVTRVLGRLGPQFRRRGRRRGAVVVGAPAGERHAIPVAIMADMARGAGWDVVELGADVPATMFAEAASLATRPVAVAVGLTIDGGDDTVRQIVAEVGKSARHVPVVVGGAGVRGAAHARDLGAARWTGTDARSALAVLNQLSVVSED